MRQNKKEIQKQIELDDKQYNNTLIALRKANRKIIELETEIKIILIPVPNAANPKNNMFTSTKIALLILAK